MRRLALASLLSLVGVGVGCGLISSDVAEIKFNLPPRMYSFDSSTVNVPAGITGEVPCGAGQIVTDCCNPPAPLPAPDCSANPITCEQNENGMDVCMAQATISQSQTMNLGQEVQQLSGLTGIVSISIKRISYEITANTLDIDVPDVVLYLAPNGVTDPNDRGAKKFGTLPAIPAMTTTTGDVILEPNAAAVLESFTANLQTPFTFIAATTLKVSHSPTGKIDMTISGQLAASP
jgi:hypothetical protein